MTRMLNSGSGCAAPPGCRQSREPSLRDLLAIREPVDTSGDHGSRPATTDSLIPLIQVLSKDRDRHAGVGSDLPECQSRPLGGDRRSDHVLFARPQRHRSGQGSRCLASLPRTSRGTGPRPRRLRRRRGSPVIESRRRGELTARDEGGDRRLPAGSSHPARALAGIHRRAVQGLVRRESRVTTAAEGRDGVPGTAGPSKPRQFAAASTTVGSPHTSGPRSARGQHSLPSGSICTRAFTTPMSSADLLVTSADQLGQGGSRPGAEPGQRIERHLQTSSSSSSRCFRASIRTGTASEAEGSMWARRDRRGDTEPESLVGQGGRRDGTASRALGPSQASCVATQGSPSRRKASSNFRTGRAPIRSRAMTVSRSSDFSRLSSQAIQGRDGGPGLRSDPAEGADRRSMHEDLGSCPGDR